MKYRAGYAWEGCYLVLEAPAGDLDEILRILWENEFLYCSSIYEIEDMMLDRGFQPEDIDEDSVNDFAVGELGLEYVQSLDMYAYTMSLVIEPVPPNSALGYQELGGRLNSGTPKSRFRKQRIGEE